jgi:hypothetical protein
VAEILNAFWAFLGIASPDCSGFENQSHLPGVARSTYVGPPFRNTSRVGGGVELKKTAIFVLIRAEIGPTKKCAKDNPRRKPPHLELPNNNPDGKVPTLDPGRVSSLRRGARALV